MHEGFKSRLPEYKQMASDLRVVNQSFHKLGDSVQKAGASLHKQAIMADGLINSVSTHVAEAQQAFPTLHTDIMSGLDAANNIMDSTNKIASYKIDVPAASQNIGNIDLSNALRDLGADPSRVYDRKNDGDLSFILGITPIIGTGKEIGQLIKGEDLVTGQKYGPEDYAWGTLAVVSGGTTRVVGKVFGKVADLENKAKNLEKVSKNYRKTFFDQYPGLKGNVVVHHAVEQQVLKKYPNLFTEAEIYDIENLRGIPKEINNEVHLSSIRKDWNEFYKSHPNPTKKEVIDYMIELDKQYGDKFTPPVNK
ncbi:hypothetical protein COI83_29825 [Bacillus cereus]|nr:hypothetical protein COI83_29825 [Bacillus cereus]